MADFNEEPTLKEPSVLDYVKSKLVPWKYPPLRIPELQNEQEGLLEPHDELEGVAVARPSSVSSPKNEFKTWPETRVATSARPLPWPWLALLVLFLGLVAQGLLERRPGGGWTAGALFYALATASLVIATWRGEWKLSPAPREKYSEDTYNVGWKALWLGVALAMLAFLAFGGNRFNSLNLILWFSALACLFTAFWLPRPARSSWQESWYTIRKDQGLTVRLSFWSLAVLTCVVLVIFFRVYRLAEIPPEMTSDHAEKLLDVFDVLNGQAHIFFIRNTGREFFQFYLTAGVIKLFQTGYSFLSLKIGTVLCGLFTLPFIYLLGKEVANRRVGLIALVFAGIAYWPNLVTRIALRFTFYPFFLAPTLYFLLRGMRTSNRNDFILAGLFLGLGLHGYSPFRVVPLVVVVAFVLYLLHRQSNGVRSQAVWGFSLLVFVSIIVFLPLLRFSVDNPGIFSYRTLTRMGTVERLFPAPAAEIFLGNLWNAITMFAWDSGEIWTFTVSQRPALDLVSGALFHLGVILLLVRYLRRRHWLDLFLLVSIPLLMLPSILSLAFPNENPALNRAAGAIVPVFLIVAIALEGFLASLKRQLGEPQGTVVAWILGLALLTFSASQNYDLVFNQYQNAYRLYSWNTSEMGRVIRSFADSVGSADTAWVIPYPHWVDTRLVGMNAGYPARDYAIPAEELASTLDEPAAKLFLLYPDDQQSLSSLRRLYPWGTLKEYTSSVETKDFLIYFVPPLN